MQSCGNHHWTLKLPDDWQCEADEESWRIHHPKGVGILELTSAEQPSIIHDDDLPLFAADQIEQGVRPRPVTLGDFRGIELIYEHEQRYWRDWLLYHGRLLLLASYNCPVGLEEKEEAMLDVVMATLKRVTATA